MLAWFIAGSLVVGTPALKDKPGGQEPYGEWEAEEAVLDSDGNKVRLRMCLKKDGTWQLFGLGKGPEEPRRFSFDAKALPPTLDLHVTWSSPGLPKLCIYKVDGDRLTICSSFPPGKARPTEFVAKPDGVAIVQHFRRVVQKD